VVEGLSKFVYTESQECRETEYVKNARLAGRCMNLSEMQDSGKTLFLTIAILLVTDHDLISDSFTLRKLLY
jgi:hypothetical protein